MKPMGTITKYYPFIDDESKSILNSLMEESSSYYEFVQHLDDLILRRSLLAMQGQLTMLLLEELADIGQVALSWSSDERQKEIDRTLALLKDRHGVIVV